MHASLLLLQYIELKLLCSCMYTHSDVTVHVNKYLLWISLNIACLYKNCYIVIASYTCSLVPIVPSLKYNCIIQVYEYIGGWLSLAS